MSLSMEVNENLCLLFSSRTPSFTLSVPEWRYTFITKLHTDSNPTFGRHCIVVRHYDVPTASAPCSIGHARNGQLDAYLALNSV